MDKLLDRFFKYISFETQAIPHNKQLPSSIGQKELADLLMDELKAIGLIAINFTENGNLVATLPATVDYAVPSIAFIGHLDTAAYVSNGNLTPQFIHHYRGNDILLGRGNGVLSPKHDLALNKLLGKTLIVGDGLSVLGAASKAGIAEIMTALVEIKKNKTPHGEIKILFLTDQTLLKAEKCQDIINLDVDRAYSVDSQGLGVIGVENLNIARARIKITGKKAYLGVAKNIMTNALHVAIAFHAHLPENDMRELTSYYEGFYQFLSMSGCVECAEMEYLLCDFSEHKLQQHKQHFLNAIEEMRVLLPFGCDIQVEINDLYVNQSEIIENEHAFIEITEQAMRSCGVEPIVVAVREILPINAKVTQAGIPCITLSNGGYNFNSSDEFVVVEEMEKSMLTLQKIIQFTAESSAEAAEC